LRDKPSFDDLEPPVIVTTPIDGMSDEEWAERNLRGERRVRVAFGIAIGLFIGLVSILHLRLLSSRSALPALLVVSGCMLLFAVLFAQRRDDEALGHAAWIAFPEWSLVESLPLWTIAMVFSIAVAVLLLLVVVAVIGHFPFAGR
jgi:hypothetical protein